MNLVHLKYAVEVAKTRSITQAAENLYMGQPNLSKAIRELEATVGIPIFKRTTKGVTLTPQGSEFIERAKKVLEQIDEMEHLFRAERENKISFSICIPRASYITHAFTRFVNHLDPAREMEINFQETNTIQAINNVTSGEYRLGIIRYPVEHEDYFISLLGLRGAQSLPVCEFEYLVLMAQEHPLARCERLDYDMLADYTEILHGDLANPASAFSREKRPYPDQQGRRRIYVYERGSQFDLLRQVHTTYMWVSPLPAEMLGRYGLIQRRCHNVRSKYKDRLIHPKEYHLSELDRQFLSELNAVRDEIFSVSYDERLHSGMAR